MLLTPLDGLESVVESHRDSGAQALNVSGVVDLGRISDGTYASEDRQLDLRAEGIQARAKGSASASSRGWVGCRWSDIRSPLVVH